MSEDKSAPPKQPENTAGGPTRKPVIARPKLWLAVFGTGVLIGLSVYFWWYETNGRYYESTDDAYINTNIVRITPQIEGTVQEVSVDDTDHVTQGQVLVRLDPLPFQIAYERAKAQYRLAILGAAESKAMLAQRQAILAQEEAAFANAHNEAERRKLLVEKAFVSKESMASYLFNEKTAQARVAAAKQDVEAALARLSGSPNLPAEQQPAVQVAEQNLRQAYKDLSDTTLRAPVSGIVAKRSVQLGQQVSPGQALMSVIPLSESWVDANFKETQMKHIRLHQIATITIDTYGSQPFKAEVIGIGSGTGAAFSLLPPQNATGNWVKVVQRVPVRLKLLDRPANDVALAVGLSATVSIDTRSLQKDSTAISMDGESDRTDRIRGTSMEEIDHVISKIVSQTLASLTHQSNRMQGGLVADMGGSTDHAP